MPDARPSRKRQMRITTRLFGGAGASRAFFAGSRSARRFQGDVSGSASASAQTGSMPAFPFRHAPDSAILVRFRPWLGILHQGGRLRSGSNAGCKSGAAAPHGTPPRRGNLEHSHSI